MFLRRVSILQDHTALRLRTPSLYCSENLLSHMLIECYWTVPLNRAWICRMIVCRELEEMWKEAVITYLSLILKDRGSIPGRGKWFFSLASVFRSVLKPTQAPIQWVQGGRGLFSGGKARQGRDANHSLIPRSRMSTSCTSSPPWCQHSIVGQFHFIHKFTQIYFTVSTPIGV
jgi:hypothetical protein